MKKHFYCFLVIMLLLCSAAFAEAEFALHNGLKYGMTVEEACETEKAAGVILKEGDLFHEWCGTIAGQPNSKLLLAFAYPDKKLYNVIYSFDTLESYENLNHGLIQKYGETPYSSKTGAYLGDYVQTDCVNELGFATDIYSNAEYSQWLIPYSDTQSVLIYHFAFKRDRISHMSSVEGFSRVEHNIWYQLLDEQTTQKYRTPYSNDL